MELQVLYYVQNTIIGLSVLTLIFHNLIRQGRLQYSQRIFAGGLIVNAMLLVLELAITLGSGHLATNANFNMHLASVLLYILTPAPVGLWVLYTFCIINKDKKPSRALYSMVFLPFLINALLSFFSLFGDFVFFIDSNNTYNRGRFFFLMPTICYSYLFLYLYIILKNKKSILKSEFDSLFLAALPPLAGGLIQNFFYGISLVWIATTFSLLFIYLRLQNVQINTDYLTGLANRRKFDSHLDYLLSLEDKPHRSKEYRIGGIMIDVNRFKQVNDIYGHPIGDRVLESVGEILKRSVQKGDFLARVGGDEFAVLSCKASWTSLKETVTHIKHNMACLSGREDCPSDLTLSFGYALYEPEKGMSSRDFMRLIDSKMYDDKRQEATEYII